MIGTPTWWYTIPAIRTFLTTHDFKNKTIIPFQTSCGWPGHGIQDIKKLYPGAIFKHEMKISFSPQTFGVITTKEKILNAWLMQIQSEV